MKTQKIFSKNAYYQKFEVLKTNRNKRYRYNEFFVEGVRNINEAIKNDWKIVSLIYSFENELSSWASDIIKNTRTKVNYELTNNLMQGLSGKDDTSEIMAVIEMREDDANKLCLSDNPILAVFDRPSNKGNLGTIIRSCDAFGVECLALTGHCVDLYDPDVIVASMGSFFKVSVIRMPDNTVFDWIAKLKNIYKELKVIGTTSHHEERICEIDLKTPLLFLIGNETEGLSNKLKEISDIMATIPMNADSSATSFNVACAATVMFYEAMRQRSSNF